jgi:Cytosol aminopeptidase family, N-terminal domain
MIGQVGSTAFYAATGNDEIAHVDAAVHCMFARDVPGPPSFGRVYEVDKLLGGALVRLREDGFFGGKASDVLTLSNVPPALKADRLVILGLGEAEHWTPALMREVSHRAMVEVLRAKASTASFSPCFAEGIHDTQAIEAAYEQIGIGVSEALEAGYKTMIEEDHKRINAVPLDRWVFDLQGPHAQEANHVLTSYFSSWQPRP